MRFGSDMWSWLRFVIGLIRLLKQIFGDEEDKEDIEKNGINIDKTP